MQTEAPRNDYSLRGASIFSHHRDITNRGVLQASLRRVGLRCSRSRHRCGRSSNARVALQRGVTQE
jgi:hypothetical protein